MAMANARMDIFCDRCRDYIEVVGCENAITMQDVEDVISYYGWTDAGEGTHYCDDCSGAGRLVATMRLR